MKTMEQTIPAKKIKREKPNKKWTPEEIKIVLDYLEEATDIEVPTAQIFYKKLISKTGINASWDLIRWKVRYLKTSYKKANDWRNSTGAGLLECDTGASSVEAKILQMCPHYHQLSKIFGEKTQNELTFQIVDSGELTTMDESLITEDINDVSFINEDNSTQDSEFVPVVEVTSEDIAKTSTGEISKKAQEFAEKIKKCAPKSSSAYLAAFQAERTSLFKLKFEWEKERQEKETEFNRKKMELEEEKMKADIEIRKHKLELKAKEIERDERLKIMEIEKDERLKKYEIDMRYKHQNN